MSVRYNRTLIYIFVTQYIHKIIHRQVKIREIIKKKTFMHSQFRENSCFTYPAAPTRWLCGRLKIFY